MIEAAYQWSLRGRDICLKRKAIEAKELLHSFDFFFIIETF
jgi:hypothetical protein